MHRRFAAYAVATAAALCALVGLSACAKAQGAEYRFEAVSSDVLPGEGVRIEVRVLAPDGGVVPADQITITSVRLDMGPDGMATMAAPLTEVEMSDANTLAFQADLAMAGRWALTLEATVEGVDEPITGVVVYTAAQNDAAITPAANAAGERLIAYYRNPMGLPDISLEPKKDSMGMDYIPVYADEVSGDGATVRISPEKIQRTGVRTAPVERLSLMREVRGSGMVLADEGRTAVVTAKFSGFVERLTVRTTGEQVRAGQPLLTLWVESADLLQKMVDLATAARTGQPTETAARNLRIFGVSEDDIASIVRSDASLRTITLTAPLSGTVLEKPAFDGTRFEPGDVLFRVADLSSVWVIANVAEQDLALVRPGLVARLTLSSYPGETIEGTVDFIYPELDLETRSGRVRLIVPNAQGRLRLGMFVHAAIDAPIGESAVLAIPISAVIDDGERQVAFVARGEGRFEPRDLVLGARAGDLIEVRGGLTEGDEVVAQGTFLIDAESNLQSALATFTAGPGVQ